jgi:hypothetical protein
VKGKCNGVLGIVTLVKASVTAIADELMIAEIVMCFMIAQ